MLLKIQRRKKNVLFMVIIGGIIGWLAGMITGRDIPFGILPYLHHVKKMFVPQ
ncbi:GlsB/YeaQ/YmgE family stress response membrane protein [Peribacillus sp. TH27]|uniref:GlsB/YeaQ/YmgE family stress response membrane protein n=1 Tax=Peribacillus sp. TH27 TaxID=2798484 RepID=UPI0019149E06|nr:hypothetical protein [Peribacillus sp. TH27]MBK5461910.1 hypothetical protein [Peribacillus sp. TH27]